MGITSISNRAAVFSILINVVTLPSIISAQSQNYQPIRFDLGPSYIITDEYWGGWGIGSWAELKYNLKDQIAVGVRVDGIAALGGMLSDKPEISQKAGVAFLLKGDYFFSDHKIRPFAGMGMGMYIHGGQKVSTGTTGTSASQAAGKFFGIAPEIGIDLSHFRISLVYNILMGSTMEASQTVTTGGTSIQQAAKISQNYWGIEIGGYFGGGKK